MKPEHISDALQYLDDDLLMETTSLRNRKQGGFSMKKRASVLIAAVLITALCCVTAFAAVSGGWFVDVKNITGAITGTEYHNATDEISVAAEADGGILTVTVTFLVPEQPPYREIETLRIGEYTVSDSSGKTVHMGSKSDAAPVINGSAQPTVSVDMLPAGDYTLHIETLIGEKKADQPLPIYGDWVCTFAVTE